MRDVHFANREPGGSVAVAINASRGRVAELGTLGRSTPLPMTSALKKPINTSWLKRTVRVVLFVLGAFTLYALSFGPVLRVCGVRPSTGWSGLPSGVRLVYAPLTHAPEPLAGVLDHYVQWWIGVQ
jgi:hypothetical protein